MRVKETRPISLHAKHHLILMKHGQNATHGKSKVKFKIETIRSFFLENSKERIVSTISLVEMYRDVVRQELGYRFQNISFNVLEYNFFAVPVYTVVREMNNNVRAVI